ncbi:MAG: 2-oxoacid:acceptor oxidoreductase family protein, partial [Acidimicrobiales bacterium]
AVTVIVGDTEIGSPVVDRADCVVALNPPSLAKYEGLLAPGGLLVLNVSLIEAEPSRTDIEIVRVPCTALAKTAGDDRLVSVVALGALLARRPLVELASVRAAIEAIVSKKRPEILNADLGALEAGHRAAAGALASASR